MSLVIGNIDLLDPNLYSIVPIWVYVCSGLVVINVIGCCCYVCKRNNIGSRLKMRELELEKREMELNKRIAIERDEKELRIRKKEMDKEYKGITISKPRLYTDVV